MTRPRLFCCILVSSLAVIHFASRARADDGEVILPAGTLIRCTLDEPNFSTKTAEAGDPVICHLNQLLLFDRSVFPRGAYLGGHLEAAKEPGHFVGKGYLQLEFDKIGMPEGQVPVPAKVISAKGYRVDRQGKIIGHGHPVRDAVEWIFPPLWPEKVLTLPARGPRPTLKGEELLTLRLMDDVAVPAGPTLGRRNFGDPRGKFGQGYTYPSRYIPGRTPEPAKPPSQTSLELASAKMIRSEQTETDNKIAAANGKEAKGPETDAVTRTAAAHPVAPTSSLNLLVLRNGTRFFVTALHPVGNQLTYVRADGTTGVLRLDDIDWTETLQKNAENGVTITPTMENDGPN
jgi:hypothetical protein